MAREIPLTKGYVAIVDDEDFDWLSQWKWFAAAGRVRFVYACRHEGPKAARWRVTMQGRILGAERGVIIDHKNGNTLDNRRANIRLCTSSQNNRNSGIRSDNTSGFKGVHPDKKNFAARIFVDGRTVHLGNFQSPVEAALAYDRAAARHFGEFARLNFPEELAA